MEIHKKSNIIKFNLNRNSAVSEVVGTILLLGIAVTLFSVVYITILGIPHLPPTPVSNIAYSINDEIITLTHIGGKPLDLNAEVKILINDELFESYKLGDYLDENETNWGLGEKLKFDLSGNISESDYSIGVQVIDLNSNSIVMMGKTVINNRPPVIYSPEPYNDETYVSKNLAWLNITISEPDNNAFNWTIETEPDIGDNSGSMQIYTENNFQCNVSGLLNDVEYTWYVNATDTYGYTAERIFTFTTGTIQPSIEHKDAIDINFSNVDSSADRGTEIDFNNSKANITDANVMIIKEYRPPSYNINDTVDDNSINKDASADKGIETNFVNCIDTLPDTDEMILLETDQGIGAIDENLNVNGVTSDYISWSTSGINPWLNMDDTTNVITGNTNNQQRGWFTFDDTIYTGSGFSVTLYVDFDAGDGNDDCDWFIDWNGDGTSDVSGTFSNPTTAVVSTGIISGLDTITEINNARLRLDYKKSGGGGIMTVDHAYLNIQRAAIIDYELDMEYQFNNANYQSDNEQLCFYLTGGISESLLVDYYLTGTGWINLGLINSVGWNNFTATGLISSTYNIRLYDENQTNEETQNSWDIDCMFLHTWNNSDYQIDFEYQFTSVNYSDDYEKLCIYVTSISGSEPLNINYWDGDSWELLGTITGTGWKNVIATNLINSTYTIQLKGTTEVSDNEQDEWRIDCIYLHTWTY
jgi:FlaG/FlaF family flagellin (archaellin)